MDFKNGSKNETVSSTAFNKIVTEQKRVKQLQTKN